MLPLSLEWVVSVWFCSAEGTAGLSCFVCCPVQEAQKGRIPMKNRILRLKIELFSDYKGG